MADPVVTLTNGVPTSGTGTITTLGQTLIDGANATMGVTTGAAVTTNAAGTLQQYLRGIVSLLVSGITVATHAVTQSGSWVLSAGSAIIGKVGIDQTTDGTTNLVRLGAETTKVIGTANVQPAASETKVTAATIGTGGVGYLGWLSTIATYLATLATSVANTTSTGWLAVNLRKADGTEITFNGNGQTTMSASAPVVLASDQSAVKVTPADQYGAYETVAASQTAQALGATGATGDYLAGVLVFPGTAGCGVVTILDNATTIGTFAGGGTTALPSLVPFLIPVGLFSVSGAWKITTGANVTAVGIGKFT